MWRQSDCELLTKNAKLYLWVVEKQTGVNGTLHFGRIIELFSSLCLSRGCLFYGPPGTGKTLVARALANECSHGNRKVAFFMRKGADCLSKWVGESERQLRLLFEQVTSCKHAKTNLKSLRCPLLAGCRPQPPFILWDLRRDFNVLSWWLWPIHADLSGVCPYSLVLFVWKQCNFPKAFK